MTSSLPQSLIDLEDLTRRLNEKDARLKLSEAKYRGLFESLKDAVLLVDCETGIIIEGNPIACLLYGYPVGDLIGRPLDSLCPTCNDGPTPIFDSPLINQKYNLRKDGTTFPVEFSSSILTLDGQKIGILVIRDISERCRISREVQVSEHRLKAVLDHLEFGVLICRNDRIIFTNHETAVLTGYSVEDLMDMESQALFPHCFPLSTDPCTIAMRCSDGTERPVKVRTSTIERLEGEVIISLYLSGA